jgi:large conductance mechanosensitive channel
MGILKEFRDFAARGNVVDLAVGLVIGTAFGKIVTSLVNDVIMPPVGMVINGVKFSDIKYTIKDAVTDASGKVVSEAVTLNIGNFLQTIFDFIIIAFAVFIVVKAYNRLRKKEAQEPATAPAPTREEALLIEIRDAIREKK